MRRGTIIAAALAAFAAAGSGAESREQARPRSPAVLGQLQLGMGIDEAIALLAQARFAPAPSWLQRGDPAVAPAIRARTWFGERGLPATL